MAHAQFKLPETNDNSLVLVATGYLAGVGAGIAHISGALNAEGIAETTKNDLTTARNKCFGSQRWLLEQLADRFDACDATAKAGIKEVFGALGEHMPNALYGKAVKKGIISPNGAAASSTAEGSTAAA